jgi:hypothetical protein
MKWSALGAVAPAGLAGARDQAHHAVQVIAAAGETHLPHVPDTSHTALVWSDAHRALLGRATPGEGLRVGLRLADLALLVVDGGGVVRDERALPGETVAGAYAWTARALAERSGGRLAQALVHPGYPLPPHPLDRGARFEAEGPALEELARWYANADRALQALARSVAGAGEVLVWPHHFDIATLAVLATDAEGDASQTLGVGLSPGDEFIGVPYWYVNHWPTREDVRPEQPGALGPLAAGQWHTEDWLGAVLRAEELVAAGDGPAQEARLDAFLASAVAANRALIG